MATARQQPPWRQPTLHPESSADLPPLKVWNSLTRTKTPFIPIDPKGKKVSWYACGPTVYDDAHLGHARNYVSTDILRRILRDYFKFDVKFIMNITDVDDKIILRGRQQYLFDKYMTSHLTVNQEVVDTAITAYKIYLKEKLPLLDPELSPNKFEEEVEKSYAVVLNGGALDGSGKPGDKEAKIKMHIKTLSSAARAITEASEILAHPISPVDPVMFYPSVQDVILPYLDALEGSSIGGEDHSIFTKLTQKYEARFMRDVRDLNVQDPDEITRVTEYGPEIADFVKKIVENKFGYVTSDGSVYFDIEAFEASGNDYARLEPWNKSNQELVADGEGALTRTTGEKRSKADFALWKASKPGEPSWTSAWGKGRPGWHIECSAMASARLGKEMDIHSGGIDLAFPHHDNELAQSEAYWHDKDSQWVNYFLHMGHLSIQGSKMSKSLKNFTTIREALDRGDWTPRSLRIIFLLGGWREGIEITEDLIKAGVAWEDKMNNFFMKMKDPTFREGSSSGTDDSLATALKATQTAVYEALCDSFNTSAAMSALSELVTKYNSIEDKSALSTSDIEITAKYVTSMVNIFGLNGSASVDSTEIGWSGIDIPEPAKPFVYPLSAMRDSLRQAARAKEGISEDTVMSVVREHAVAGDGVDGEERPYFHLYRDFRNKISSLEQSDTLSRDILSLCDQVRDIDLFDMGIYLEDRDNRPALVRPVTKELLQARAEKAERARQKQVEKENKEKEALKKAEKGKLSHLEMYRTNEYSAWDEDGLPTKDAAGEEITKSRAKKLRKDWERQKKAHEIWLGSQKS